MYFVGDRGFAKLVLEYRMVSKLAFIELLVSQYHVPKKAWVWALTYGGEVFMVGIGPVSSVWVMVEQHHEGLEVRNAGLADLMDFRTRYKVVIWTSLLPRRVSYVRECAGWVPSGQWCSVCLCPQEAADYLPHIILALWRCYDVAHRRLPSCRGCDWGTFPPRGWTVLSKPRGGEVWNIWIVCGCV